MTLARRWWFGRVWAPAQLGLVNFGVVLMIWEDLGVVIAQSDQFRCIVCTWGGHGHGVSATLVVLADVGAAAAWPG